MKMTESKRITGTEYYEIVQDILNSGRSIVNESGGIIWNILWDGIGCSDGMDVYCDITLTEYRRLYSLFESLGGDMDEFSEKFFTTCEMVDHEMFSEWMRYWRNKNRNFDTQHMYEMNFYAEKFEMDVRDIFKYIYNDDDGEYLKFITEYLTSYPDYPTYFPDDWLYPEPDEGRRFDIMSEDVEELIAGKLIV